MWARKSQTFVSHNKKFYSNVSYHHCLLFSMRGTVAVVDQTTDALTSLLLCKSNIPRHTSTPTSPPTGPTLATFWQLTFWLTGKNKWSVRSKCTKWPSHCDHWSHYQHSTSWQLVFQSETTAHTTMTFYTRQEYTLPAIDFQYSGIQETQENKSGNVENPNN